MKEILLYALAFLVGCCVGAKSVQILNREKEESYTQMVVGYKLAIKALAMLIPIDGEEPERLSPEAQEHIRIIRDTDPMDILVVPDNEENEDSE